MIYALVMLPFVLLAVLIVWEDIATWNERSAQRRQREYNSGAEVVMVAQCPRCEQRITAQKKKGLTPSPCDYHAGLLVGLRFAQSAQKLGVDVADALDNLIDETLDEIGDETEVGKLF